MSEMGKLKILALLLCALLGGYAIGWAINEYYIISETKRITVEKYFITFDVNATDNRCLQYSVLNFSGTLGINGDVLVGEIVTLYCDGLPTAFSCVTDDDGYYEILYPAITLGTFDFYANATIT